MKIKDLLADLLDDPELENYHLCLSKYMVIPIEEADGVKNADLVVIDFPIIGIAINNESKEVRFVLSQSDHEAIESIETEYFDVDIEDIGEKE